MTNKLLVQDNNRQFHIFYLIAVPVIIFLYFLQWKIYLFHGDDIYTYSYYMNLKTFAEKMNLPASAGKFRPIHAVSLQLIIDSFGNNANGYYWFNVLIQSINTLIFARLLNLYLKSYLFSLLFSLLLGLSRLSIYNITQLTNGGALEGLGMMFSITCLYFIIKSLRSDGPESKGSTGMLYAILFANFSTYTHERYIVLLPFLLLVLFFRPTQEKSDRKQKGLLATLILGSIILNVLLKKYVFGMPFFLGTSSAQIEFSISTAFSFLIEAVSSIFLINTGEDFVAGISFASLGVFYKTLIIILLCCVFLILTFYLQREIRNSSFKKRHVSPGITVFILLSILFFLFLAPTIITIRLEQRWLQASFSVLILVIVIALTSFKYKSITLRNILFALFALAFLVADREYVNKGADNLFMMTSENSATTFKKAIDNGTINSSAANLYIWEKRRDENVENAIRWTLGDGYFFELYSGKNKKIIFIDSVYERSHSLADTSLLQFNAQTDQIVYVGNEITDITSSFSYDSLRSFDIQRVEAGLGYDRPEYDSLNVIANQHNFHDFYVDGFYNEENGIRWTNGHASIGFIGGYIVKDSVYIELKTYLPPPCKNILPSVSLLSENNKPYKTLFFEKKDDNFLYSLYFEKPEKISKIVIQSDTINSFPDLRRLSFPFVSLELKQTKHMHKK